MLIARLKKFTNQWLFMQFNRAYTNAIFAISRVTTEPNMPSPK